MGRDIKHDKIYTEMLEMLRYGVVLQSYFIKKIREQNIISRQALEDRIKTWEANKIIWRKGKEISLRISLPSNGSLPETYSTNTVQENYCLKYPLKDYLDPKDPPIVLKSAGYLEVNLPVDWLGKDEFKTNSINGSLQASFRVEGLTVRLNTRSLEIWSPLIYATSRIPSIVMESRAKTILDKIALDVEAQLQHNARFKLQRLKDGTLVSYRVDIELEEEEHLMAQAKPKDYKFEVYHPIDGQLRAEINYSRGSGKPDFAFMHKKDAGVDRDTTNKQFNLLFEGQMTFEEIIQTRINVRDLSAEVRALSLDVTELAKIVRELIEKRKI